jgi:hypothetical protein
MDVFQAPQKQGDGSYMLEFVNHVEFPVELRWEKNAEFPTPDLRIQSALNAFREKTLKDLVKNRALFRSSPTQSSLSGLTPIWGIILHGNTMEWSRHDIWTKDAKNARGCIVLLEARGIHLSRQSIVPIWGVKVCRSLPDALIDLEFGEEEEANDGESVDLEEIASEEGVLNLKDPGERKRQMKQYVRDLLSKASHMKMEADSAMDRFFSEFDLSEDESDFSDLDD